MNVLGNNSCTGCAAIKAIEGGMLFRVFDFNYACKANPANVRSPVLHRNRARFFRSLSRNRNTNFGRIVAMML